MLYPGLLTFQSTFQSSITVWPLAIELELEFGEIRHARSEMLTWQSMGSNRRARKGIRRVGLLPVLMPIAVLLLFLLLFLMRSAATPQPESFRFVILGDRTGEARPGVYEQVWQEAAAEDPAFVVTTGDID